ncbi:MAG TPA: hypothetical protein VG842_06630 [Sediminibacterium sp.]|nr:hypothetical protein [Sediminibacterium sp.]
MRTRYFILLLIAGWMKPGSIQAQKTSDTEPRKNEISASLNYQSVLHYFGRTDSLRSSGLFPMLNLQSKWGVYAQGTVVFVQNKALPLQYTGSLLEAGYRFKQTEHFAGNIFYTGIFYKDNSVVVQSALRGQTGFNASYLNKVVNINTGMDLKFSDHTDLGLTLGIDHLFLVHSGSSPVAFAADPSAYIYAGSRQFTETYINKNGPLGLPAQTTATVNKLQVLSYEFSVPLVLVAGNFNASVTPAYTLPMSLLPEENGKNLFTVTLSMGVKF